jgi:protein gp37
MGWPWPNVWLGTTVENQAEAARRIPSLLSVPAIVHFLSVEPLLGPIDLSIAPAIGRSGWLRPLTGDHQLQPIHADHRGARIDWCIVGGESGPHARPMHPDWARSLRDQCRAASTAYFFKQWGEWVAEGYPGQNRGPSVRWLSWSGEAWGEYQGGNLGDCVARVGKHTAGRLLDGQEWSQFPDQAALNRQQGLF